MNIQEIKNKGARKELKIVIQDKLLAIRKLASFVENCEYTNLLKDIEEINNIGRELIRLKQALDEIK